MPQIDSVLSRLTPLMQECFDNDDVVATPELTAADVQGWDSLAHVRFMLTVERIFAVKFSAAEMASFENVGQLASAIAAKAAVGV
jgi:acyl carrier protein